MLASVSSKLRAWLSPQTRPNPPLDLFDLLGRAPVCLDTPELQRFLAGKTILVSGAGGSIGSEICRQAMKFCPRRLVMVERAENALFEIDRELRERWVGADLLPAVADITDPVRISRIFSEQTPDVVFHCAAHKHVPMMEANPGEAVKNNVLGTKVLADAAAASACDAFVLVSTDKAVNPTSVMGATKRCAELYVQSLNGSGMGGSPMQTLEQHGRAARATTMRFLAVRFGNVLGSSGSVVPIFRKQIETGGPLTVTHPDMQRYFMTIPEASQLVMQAGAIGRGGEIFVLDMGQPVRILDLAREMIRRSGLTEGHDIDITFTGIRPGEKLYEELSCHNELTCPTSHPKINVWQLPPASPDEARQMIDLLATVTDSPREAVLRALSRCVPEYQSPLAPQESDAAPHLRLVA